MQCYCIHIEGNEAGEQNERKKMTYTEYLIEIANVRDAIVLFKNGLRHLAGEYADAPSVPWLQMQMRGLQSRAAKLREAR